MPTWALRKNPFIRGKKGIVYYQLQMLHRLWCHPLFLCKHMMARPQHFGCGSIVSHLFHLLTSYLRRTTVIFYGKYPINSGFSERRGRERPGTTRHQLMTMLQTIMLEFSRTTMGTKQTPGWRLGTDKKVGRNISKMATTTNFNTFQT